MRKILQSLPGLAPEVVDLAHLVGLVDELREIGLLGEIKRGLQSVFDEHHAVQQLERHDQVDVCDRARDPVRILWP